jgi:hypothetical protein
MKEKSDEDVALYKAGQVYALTKRPWLPKLDVKLDENSTDPAQVDVREYIQALPESDKEDWQDLSVISLVSNHSYSSHLDTHSTSIIPRQFDAGMDSIRTNMAHRVRHQANDKIFPPEILNVMKERSTSLLLKKLNHFNEIKDNYLLSAKKIPVLALKPVQDGEKSGILAGRVFRNEVLFKVCQYYIWVDVGIYNNLLDTSICTLWTLGYSGSESLQEYIRMQVEDRQT